MSLPHRAPAVPAWRTPRIWVLALACILSLAVAGRAAYGAATRDPAAPPRPLTRAQPPAPRVRGNEELGGARRAEARAELEGAEARLAGLERGQVSVQRVLAAQLVGTYEGGRPQLIDVVLASTGVEDLLSQLALARRIGAHDAQVLADVRGARAAVASEAVRVGALSPRPERLVARPAPPGEIVAPLPATAVAPVATWSVGEGVDIAAPADTVERAVCSGTIILRGIGGLGPWTPVLRCAQAVGGHHDVFYGAAGPARLPRIGDRVVAGQPIARVGGGIVGDSSGPHLQIGFTDAGGTPLGSDATRRMLGLLHAAYGADPVRGRRGHEDPILSSRAPS